jgi:23S rRNA (cytidine1920-2'-O)/16S rRNA (cytidine1409-2'-O)-methyltransferase
LPPTILDVRRRLDVDLVRRKLVDSRELAQDAIASGRVLVSGSIVMKSSYQVDAGQAVELVGPGPRFVGRGGEKLEGALEHFGIDVTGCTALDAGASTGGFTDCLLQRGASRVVAVDVGHGQLHERLRADDRVESHERMNIRTVKPVDLGGRRFNPIVGDLSFISLRAVAPSLVELAEPAADIVMLVKPQFEAQRHEVAKGKGIIKDPDIWERALVSVARAFLSVGAVMMDVMRSPITGADGNVEFLLRLKVGGRAESDDVLDDRSYAKIRAVISGATS